MRRLDPAPRLPRCDVPRRAGLCLALLLAACSMDTADMPPAEPTPATARPASEPSPGTTLIGAVYWLTDYEAAVARGLAEDKPLWVHFGENPGWLGCQHFAGGPLRDPRVLKASAAFVPVFVDTLDKRKPWARFGESWGSYPVLRVHDLDGADLAGRLDGNLVAGEIPVDDVLEQLARGLDAWRRR